MARRTTDAFLPPRFSASCTAAPLQLQNPSPSWVTSSLELCGGGGGRGLGVTALHWGSYDWPRIRDRHQRPQTPSPTKSSAVLDGG